MRLLPPVRIRDALRFVGFFVRLTANPLSPNQLR